MIIKTKIENLLKTLFPVNRSLTGEGNRKTLNELKKINSELKIKKIKCSKKVYDWVVPPEWSVKNAYVKNKYGKKIINFNENNIHLVGYSSPVEGVFSKKKLLKHLHYLTDRPNWIPYRTSYYKKYWGFCVKKTLLKSKDFVGPFYVKIDSSLKKKGNLIYGEAFKKGKSDKEILLSTYCCHPSLGNDNLSGLITASLLFNYIKKFKTNFSYRLIIVPETIGSICFLHKNEINKIKAGTIITCTAGPDKLSIKESFDSSHWINKLTHRVLKSSTNGNYITYKFKPDGSDERQFSSPGFKINTPSIHKSKYYEYSEYHTSADNLDFIKSKYLITTLNVYKKWFHQVDKNIIPERLMKNCEFKLDKYNLYPKIGGSINQKIIKSKKIKNFKTKDSLNITEENIECFKWIMHLADGNHTTEDIARISGKSIKLINQSINLFEKKKLIRL